MNTNPFSSITTSCALMHPFQWCNGSEGMIVSEGQEIRRQEAACHSVRTDVTGARGAEFNIMVFKLRHHAHGERFGYREVVLKGDPKKLNLHGQTCAVCLEDFKVKDELGVLPCQHAFHRK
ncbi:RING finger protein 122-like [Oncorhynchus nerka]|uniref:RING finger protein 122-like n=1 Tax=Oncorhynchus nerka TaxID=8023 RepID=UPI0031B83AB5